MDKQAIIETVTLIFRDILDQPDLVLNPASNASNVANWDSLSHVQLISAVEQHYKIKFPLGELQTLKNVGDMADLILKRLAKKAK
jgi:acyl carrier protein